MSFDEQIVSSSDQIMPIEEGKEEEGPASSDDETKIGDIDQKISIYVSVYEIYNENIIDLLPKGGQGQGSLNIKLDQNGKNYVKGLTQKHVESPRDVFKLLKKAHKTRSAAETNMNEKSSRSHLILTVTISTFDERDQSVTSSKLNIVDLAGSERVKHS